MTVWAFACKNESSLNRWFDGTAQDVNFDEPRPSFLIEKNIEDSFGFIDISHEWISEKILASDLSFVEEIEKEYEAEIKSITYPTSIGGVLFNEVMFASPVAIVQGRTIGFVEDIQITLT